MAGAHRQAECRKGNYTCRGESESQNTHTFLLASGRNAIQYNDYSVFVKPDIPKNRILAQEVSDPPA
jgi:hypothetical protein